MTEVEIQDTTAVVAAATEAAQKNARSKYAVSQSSQPTSDQRSYTNPNGRADLAK